MFARVKLYLFFGVLLWVLSIDGVQKFLAGDMLTYGIIGLIVFLLGIAGVHSIRMARRQKQKNKTKEDDEHLFL